MMQGAGGGPMMQSTGSPQVRNPIMTLVISMVCFIMAIVNFMQMSNELKTVLPDVKFQWWHLLIPYYGIYALLMILPAEMTRAKQKVGLTTSAQSIILYLFVSPFAMATDMNEIALKLGAKPLS